ncbi:hypothetical protein Aperf_G00000057223 [Anoplocephala perfoliata]
MSGSDVHKIFNRFTQRAGELVNKSEKTSYPQHTSELIDLIDQINPWLRKIIAATEEFVDINLATKMADVFQRNKEKTNTTDRLGAALETVAEQSEKCAPGFAAMLREAAGVHSRMAEARKAFNEEVNQTFIEDLKQFQVTVLADALKAKTTLEHCRLDLDSRKSKLKSAKTPELKGKYEAEVQKAEAEFEKTHRESVEIFEKTCQELDNLNVQLLDLIRAERNYYSACAEECRKMLKE